MLTLNKVFLMGNLTKDPELRYTPQGTPVATLRIACNSPFKSKDGQMQKETCFINVVVWRQLAEICNQYLQKGKAIFVEGRLQSRSWKDNEGKTRNVIEVNALRVQFLSGPKPVSQDNQEVKEIKEVSEIDLGDAPEELVNLNNVNEQNLEG